MTILHSVGYKHWTQVPRCYKIPIWCNFYLHQRLLSQNTEPNPMANFALLSSDKRESYSLPPTPSSRKRVYCFETVSLLGRFRLSVSSQGRKKILLPFPTFTLSPTQRGGSTQLSRPTVTNVTQGWPASLLGDGDTKMSRTQAPPRSSQTCEGDRQEHRLSK